jgi:hypothetical protein
METKHTPGPWTPEFGEAYRVRTQQDGGQVAILMNLKGRHGLAGRRNGDEVAANARLIAAAPELLEACQTFAEWLRREEAGFPAETRFKTPEGEAKWREWFDENLRVCDLAQKQARAAIAKATTPNAQVHGRGSVPCNGTLELFLEG